MTGLRASREKQALWGSTFFLFGLIMTGAATLFPVLFFSTLNPAQQLTAADCAATEHGLWVATAWWFPSLLLALGYLVVVQRHYSGKVNVAKDNQGLY